MPTADRTFTGKVTRISPAVNTRRGPSRSRRVVPNAEAVLKPGTFARVHVESGKVDEVLTLPYAALQYRYGVNRVVRRAGRSPGGRASCKSASAWATASRSRTASRPASAVAITDVESLADGALVSVTTPAGASRNRSRRRAHAV